MEKKQIKSKLKSVLKKDSDTEVQKVDTLNNQNTKIIEKKLLFEDGRQLLMD